METRKKITLSLYEDALDQLDQLTTERRRGEFVSELVRQAYRRQHATPAQVAEELRQLADVLS